MEAYLEIECKVTKKKCISANKYYFFPLVVIF
jgi:hypothetical protein